MLGAAFVVGVCGWYLLKKREFDFVRRSVSVAAIVGFVGILLSAYTGHGSAQMVAKHQPMKLAAMEGLYEGGERTNLVAFGVLRPDKEYNDDQDPMYFKIDVPINGFLSLMAFGSADAYVPGIKNIIDGGYPMSDGTIALSFDEKVANGKRAQQALRDYRAAMKDNDEAAKALAKEELDQNMQHFGYGFFNDPKDSIPPVGLTFYAFHIMVSLAGYFLAFFALIWFLNHKDKFASMPIIQILAIVSIPLAYITSQAGWIVAEVGRQPWTIQDILPASHAISNIPVSSVKTTFFVFLSVFSILLVADLKIMFRAIKNGPKMDTAEVADVE